MGERARQLVRAGFTLVEMVVVVAIILIASVLSLPAFSRIIQSSNYATAVNTVTTTLGNARALAIRNGTFTGVAFLFDVETERATAQVLDLQNPQSADLSGAPGGEENCDGSLPNALVTPAQAFWPAANSPAVELPPGTGVYGLSFAVACDDALIDQDTAHFYAGERVTEPGGRDMLPWIFPRNDARLYTELDSATRVGLDPWPTIVGDGGPVPRPDAVDAVRHSQSFFVQFTPQGTVSTTTNTGGANYINAYLELPEAPLDLENPDEDPWDDRNLFDPELEPPSGVGEAEPNREVMLRSAAALAVVDLKELGRTPSIADERSWLYRAESSAAPRPDWIEGTYVDDDKVIAISRWIDRNAQVLAFNRFTGQVMRRVER